jgi:hypothetical protein
MRALVLPTLLLLFTVGVVPGRLPLAIRVYALLVCVVALGLGVLALRRAFPPLAPLRRVAPETSRRRRPPALARIEDEVALGVAGSFDLHYHLAPRLRAIADGLLVSRRRVSPDTQPEESRRILGDEAWQLIRADRPAPEDRLARGLPPDALGRVIDSLEAI